MNINKAALKKLVSVGACIYVAVSAFLEEHHSQQQENKIEELESRVKDLEDK